MSIYLKLAIFYALLSLLFLVYWYRCVRDNNDLEIFYATKTGEDDTEECKEGGSQEGYETL